MPRHKAGLFIYCDEIPIKMIINKNKIKKINENNNFTEIYTKVKSIPKIKIKPKFHFSKQKEVELYITPIDNIDYKMLNEIISEISKIKDFEKIIIKYDGDKDNLNNLIKYIINNNIYKNIIIKGKDSKTIYEFNEDEDDEYQTVIMEYNSDKKYNITVDIAMLNKNMIDTIIDKFIKKSNEYIKNEENVSLTFKYFDEKINYFGNDEFKVKINPEINDIVIINDLIYLKNIIGEENILKLHEFIYNVINSIKSKNFIEYASEIPIGLFGICIDNNKIKIRGNTSLTSFMSYIQSSFFNDSINLNLTSTFDLRSVDLFDSIKNNLIESKWLKEKLFKNYNIPHLNVFIEPLRINKFIRANKNLYNIFGDILLIILKDFNDILENINFENKFYLSKDDNKYKVRYGDEIIINNDKINLKSLNTKALKEKLGEITFLLSNNKLINHFKQSENFNFLINLNIASLC